MQNTNKLNQDTLYEAIASTPQEKLAGIVEKSRKIAEEKNLVIGDKPVKVLPVPFVMDRKPVEEALGKLEIFINALIDMEKYILENHESSIFKRLYASLTPGGQHLVDQCTFESPNSLRRRMRRVDGYLDPVTGAYSIVEVNQAAPLALNFYDTSQHIAAYTLSELGFEYKPALIAPRILDWFIREFSDRLPGQVPKRIALVIEHGYPPKFTDLPGMAQTIEKLAKERYGQDLEIITTFPYEIRLEKSRIIANGKEIDMIWRNSVYMTSYRKKQLPIEDYERILGNPEDFIIINATRSWLTRTKETFAVFWDDDACREMGLSDERIRQIREVVPHSLNLSLHPDRIDEVIREKDAWILKPTDAGFGAGVEFGSCHQRSDWENLVKEKAVEGIVFQKRISYPRREIPLIDPQGKFCKGLVEYDLCPHHINGSFPGTALVRANAAEADCFDAVKMNLVSGGTLLPLVLV